jgi:hypothetical protein
MSTNNREILDSLLEQLLALIKAYEEAVGKDLVFSLKKDSRERMKDIHDRVYDIKGEMVSEN